MSRALEMTRAQKAAAILVAMGKPSASKLLKFFKQEELKALVEGARLLRTISQADLEKIVAEFEAEFAEGAGLMDSSDQMDTILNETLSPEEMNALMGVDQPMAAENGPPPVWPDVEKADPARIAAFLTEEHPQTAALVLSKLSPGSAANVLLVLDRDVRSEVVKRMMSMATIPEVATGIIEDQLRTRLLSESATRDTSAGQIRVASVLNEMDKDKLDEVMQELEHSGATDVQALRARLFAFEDIVQLTQKARVALFDSISTELVTLALRNAPPALTEAVLSSIGARARRMIESELGQSSDSINAADITRARKAIAAGAIRMAREGVFELPSAESAAA
ncbi:MAG: flagellar motor switch protein FliG [Mesorhizobium sp.]|nr:flagellar motor switch protein FliG [Mesorhizobium sp.]MBL8578403.1 flagellar motor switch protein FliG [Mesorhizobium sp.]